MKSHHEEWLAQAVEFARSKRYDDSRETAMRVIREDGTNIKALWIVANVTDSIPERRNALKALLRSEPDHLAARQMLDALERQYASLKGTTQMLTPIKPSNGASAPAERVTGPLLDRLKGILGK
jgi:hypothetical protein